MIVMIDNYDSFTWNLEQYLQELGAEVKVFRNDAVTVEQVHRMRPERIVISPGPKRPEDAGVSCGIIKELGPVFPILGVCLGHQCIGHVYGGRVVRARTLMHGKTSLVSHGGSGLYAGLSNPFLATRYHSLVIKPETCPDCLEITAQTKDGVIMAVAHKDYPVWGVQFHPESILTQHGKTMIRNFVGV